MLNGMIRAAASLALIGIMTVANAQLAGQENEQSGVTLAVTPGNLGTDANVWDFAVKLDTHSQDLADDLANTAVLTDGKGGEFKPIAWEGAAPGGHHRDGVLKFNPIAPRPEAIELRITRAGESAARLFRWQLR